MITLVRQKIFKVVQLLIFIGNFKGTFHLYQKPQVRSKQIKDIQRIEAKSQLFDDSCPVLIYKYVFFTYIKSFFYYIRVYIERDHPMCGHDGHVACLVAFVPKFLAHIDKIPSDKTIRLLFQPSEEGPESGAKKMIEQKCLQGVDEVYGFHNVPTAPIGQFWSKKGIVMSESTVLKIKISGTGGHGSEPQKTKESIRAAVKFYQRAVDHIDNLHRQKAKNFSCSLPVFQGGQRFNVISPDVIIQGTIRSLEPNLNKEIMTEFNYYLKDLQKEGFTYQFDYTVMAPLNSNTQPQNENVLRVARKVFGDLNVGGEKELPLKASDDFGFFTQEKPGAYFFLSSSKGEGQGMVHTDTYDFNDNLIDPASTYWLQLAKDRFEVI